MLTYALDQARRHANPACLEEWRGLELKHWVLSHLGPSAQAFPHIRQVARDFHVFKKILAVEPDHRYYRHAIANLVIRKGTPVYLNEQFFSEDRYFEPGNLIDNRHKMRAAEAFVHSIVDIKTGTPRQTGLSMYNVHFEYKAGHNARPNHFSYGAQPCAAGIHFFPTCFQALMFTF